MHDYCTEGTPPQRRLVVAGILCSVTLLCACDGARPQKRSGDVAITVTYDGEPVTAGSVNLVVLGTAKSAQGELDGTGNARMRDVEVGKYTVSILPPSPPLAEAGKPTPVKEYPKIPEKFRSETTSPLQVEVKEGRNQVAFDLKATGDETFAQRPPE